MNTVLESPQYLAKMTSKALTGLAAVVVLVSLISSFTVIAPGNTGVIFNIWTGSLRSVPQGMAWRMPWITEVQSYPTALRTYTMVRRTGEGSAMGDDSIDLPTREGQHITQDISVTYNTSEDKAAQVFKSFRGSDISEIEGDVHSSHHHHGGTELGGANVIVRADFIQARRAAGGDSKESLGRAQ